MRCEYCGNGQRRPERRAQVAENGRTALVLGVPVEVCDACGQVWLSMEGAKRLDAMVTGMLASEVEIATRRYDSGLPHAA